MLDAGCGTGGLLRRIDDCAPSLERVGLELDADAAGVARRKSRAEIVVGSVNELPFPSNSFHVVLSADVLCHANVDESAALTEFCRCLRPGGSLLLNLPAYDWLLSDHDARVHNVRRYTARQRGTCWSAPGCGSGALILEQSAAASHDRAPHVGSRPRIQRRALVPGLAGRLFSAVTTGERRLGRLGLRLPFGGSVWLWAAKP